MKDKNELRPILAVAAGLLIMFSPMLIGEIYDCAHPVSTSTGHDALVQVHGYLGCLLFELLAMPFAAALSGFVGSLILRAGNPEYKGKRKWSPAAVIVLAVLGAALLLIIPRVSGFDYQQRLNGYKGIPVVRIAKLYSACGKDIKSGAVHSVEIDSAETGYDIFTYRKAGTSRGSHTNGYDTQYSLNNNGEPLAQVSLSDSRRMEMLFKVRGKHNAEIYENSGFIASFDGYDAMPSDFSSLFTLERDGDFIRRNVLENEALSDQIFLLMERDGEKEIRIPAYIPEHNSEFYFPNDTASGYSFRMVFYRGGEYLTLSNTLKL